ncbi:MAG: hypothetical protein ACOY90_00075 [Candidatus Zhuqueibacterota bacterium]
MTPMQSADSATLPVATLVVEAWKGLCPAHWNSDRNHLALNQYPDSAAWFIRRRELVVAIGSLGSVSF